ISEHRAAFPGVNLMLPPVNVVNQADSKWQTFNILKAAGVPVPATHLIETAKDLERVFSQRNTRAIWVRGAGTPGACIGAASRPCDEVAHGSGWVDYGKGWGKMIASEFLRGRNLTWCSIFHEGELVACQGRERLEYVLPHVSPSGITGAPAVS